MVTSNLPQQPTSFVGRAAEINELIALLDDPACRLLTLVGPGGIGKTRLAIAMAETQVSHFADGVWFASLQPVSSTKLAVPTIAEAIQRPIQGMEDPYQQLINNLRDSAMLLVLDNYEQLLDQEGLRLVLGILESAPSTKLLVTSREALNLQEEWRYLIAGLSVPSVDHKDTLHNYDAIQLFLERARGAHSQLSLAGEQDCIVQICALVAGMPLAIEMAASWLNVLSCEDLARRIQHGLLDTRLQNVPARHRSMAVVFGHSWQLLDENERSTFSQLSVFAGGFRSEAATYVAGANAETLASLVDKSLLTLEASGRYRMHELIRQFAEEKLNEVPEQRVDVLSRHCDYYAEFLHLRDAEFRTQQSDHVVSEINEEIDNVRVAWARAIERHRSEQIRLMARCLAEYYDFRNWYQEGAHALEQAVAVLRSDQPAGAEELTLGIVLAGQGNLRHNLGETATAEAQISEAISILLRLNAKQDLAWALGHLNRLLFVTGSYQDAEKSYRESIALARETGDMVTLAYELGRLGYILDALGRYNETRQLRHEALLHFRSIKHRLGEALTLAAIGETLCTLGEYQQALTNLQEALSMVLELGSQWHISSVRQRLGQGLIAVGQYDQASQHLERSLEIAYDVGDPLIIVYSHLIFGDLFCMTERYAQAQQHLRKALTFARQADLRLQVSRALRGLGMLTKRTADYAGSVDYLHESLALSQALGSKLEIAHNLNELGYVAIRLHNHAEAEHHFYEALRIGVENDIKPLILDTLVGIAELLSTQGDALRATELLAFSFSHPACHAKTKAHVEAILDQLRELMPSNEFAAAQQQGQTGELEALVRNHTLAFSASQLKLLGKSNINLIEPLTRRQLEVLGLIVEGRTNREIANQLHVSANTVKKHINHIFGKLAVRTRAQAIAKARELDIFP